MVRCPGCGHEWKLMALAEVPEAEPCPDCKRVGLAIHPYPKRHTVVHRGGKPLWPGAAWW